jgi:hypothetical protein
VAGDVLRTNALTALAQRARIVDEAGRPVYITSDTEDEAEGDADAELSAEAQTGDDADAARDDADDQG